MAILAVHVRLITLPFPSGHASAGNCVRLNTRQPQAWPGSPAKRCIAVLLLMLTFVLLTGLLDGGVGVTPSRLVAQPSVSACQRRTRPVAAGVLLVLTGARCCAFVLAFALQGVLYVIKR